MTEKEYFDFIEQYLQLFPEQLTSREKIVIDPDRAKL